MKKPTWVTVIGILGIVFGCFGILGGGQEMMMPKMLQMQKEMWITMEQQTAIQANKDGQAENAGDSDKYIAKHRAVAGAAMIQSMEKMFDVPEWFGTWSIYAGIAKALVSAFYLFASIRLLQLKQNAVKLFYWALGANIFLCCLKAVVGFYSFSFMTMAMTMGGLFSALIDVVLIIVVATSDKMAFSGQQEQSNDVEPDLLK